MSDSIDHTKRVLENVLSREFRDVDILKIDISEDEDTNGDPVLFVTVVFDSDDQLDSRAASAIVRHLRPELAAINELRFPIMSFVRGDDYEERASESA